MADVEMKDASAKPAEEEKKQEEQKAEEPTDCFYGKWFGACHDSLINVAHVLVFRGEEGLGHPREGRQREGL